MMKFWIDIGELVTKFGVFVFHGEDNKVNQAPSSTCGNMIY